MKNSKRLSELDGELTKIDFKIGPVKDVLMFECPSCNSGHRIMVYWDPPAVFESGAIWKKTGDSIENITIHPSIDCTKGTSDCGFHGWVKGGTVTW